MLNDEISKRQYSIKKINEFESANQTRHIDQVDYRTQ